VVNINDTTIVEELLLIIAILTISAIGSISKSYYNLLYQHKKIKIGVILLSLITNSIMIYSISFYLLSILSYRSFIGVVFLLSLINIEVYIKLSNIKNALLLIRFIIFKNEDDLKKIINDDKTQEDKKETTNNTININIKNKI
jgi:hypothetical protein